MSRLIFLMILIQLIWFNSPLSAQNFIKNPSLESHENNKIDYWSIISGTPDIASKNNEINFPITSGTFNPYKYQLNTNQKLDTIQYGNICLCHGFNSEWSEVTQVELVKSLKRNKRYAISLHAIKIDDKPNAINEISIRLTKKPLTKTEFPFKYSGEYISLTKSDRSLINSKKKWQKVSTVYLAKGNERYLTIGNFDNANQSQISELKGHGTSLYYCYDMVEIVPFSEFKDTTEIENPKVTFDLTENNQEIVKLEDPETSSVIIENTQFEFNSYELSEEADSKFIDIASKYLQKDLTLITIVGHTDNIGSTEYNLNLSEKRALAVKNKLVSLGFKSQIIQASGAGEIIPLPTIATPKIELRIDVLK